MARQLKQFCLLISIGAAVLFANLGAAQLWDEDEPIFAGAALEMFERGDWVVPYFNGHLLPDKPVLMYWLMMAHYGLFGTTEFAARCGSALVGCASVLLVWQFGRRLFSARAGFWGGVVLATSLNFDVVARAATPDSLLLFFSTLALYVFVAGTTPRAGSGTSGGLVAIAPLTLAPRWITYAASYAAMGMGMLAKGPIAVVLPTAVLGLYLLISGRERSTAPQTGEGRNAWARCVGGLRWTASVFRPVHVLRTIWSMRPLTALAAVALVAGPWYAWVGWRTEGEWLVGFFGVHNLGRFFRPMEHHRGPLFYYLVALAIGFFPWSVFFTPMVRQWRRRVSGGHRRAPGHVLLACWIAVYLGFFSLAKTKLPNYILPLYPALALLAGSWLDGWLRRPGLVLRRDLRGAWLTIGLVGAALAVVMPIVAQRYLGGDRLLGLVGLPLVIGAAVFGWLSEHDRPRPAAWSLAATAVAFALTLFAWGAVRVDRQQTSAYFADVIRRHTRRSKPQICAFGYFRPSLVFYTREPVCQCFTADHVRRFLQNRSGDIFVFTSEQQYGELTRLLPAELKVIERRPWFLRGREVVLFGPDTSATANAAGGMRSERVRK